MNCRTSRLRSQTYCIFIELACALSIVNVSIADYAGNHISATAQNGITLGNNLNCSVTVQNTGSSRWSAHSNPGWTCTIYPSWSSTYTTYYVWHTVSSAVYDTFSFTLDASDLPSDPGSYSFIIYARLANYSSGYWELMSNSPKTIEFTITERLATTEISHIICTNGIVCLTITNLTGNASNTVFRSHNLTNEWATAGSFISTSSSTNWLEPDSKTWNTVFYHIKSQ